MSPSPRPFQGFPPLHDMQRIPTGPVLVVAPHPDDEIIGCGGALALHLLRGDPVEVALVTAGGRGGDEATRLSESRAAARELGDAAVCCLGATDGDVASDGDLARRLGAVIERVAPRVIYAPSPWEMHPDHVATLHAVLAALVGRAAGRTLLLFEVNTEAMATFLLDVTPVRDRKRRALSVFASQMGLIDVVDKVDSRNRARTVNVDIPEVSHAEAFVEVDPARMPEVLNHLGALAKALGLSG